MAEAASTPRLGAPDWPAEVARLNKIICALMDRAERSTSVQSSEFSLFQTAILLEEQVSLRTGELKAALQENEKINRALRASEARFRSLLSQSLVGIFAVEDMRFTYSNAKFNEIFGYDDDEVRALGAMEIISGCDRAQVASKISSRLSGEVDVVEVVFRGLRKDGTEIDVEGRGNVMIIEEKPILFGLVMDITDRTRAEREVQALQDRLRDESTHDALTGLHNRRYLEECLDLELDRAQRIGQPVSLIMSDLDHFKAINDRHGHLGGDEVLRVTGAQLARHARTGDIYCRYGGEEFLLVLPNAAHHVALARAEQLRRSLAAEPVSFGVARIAVTASFGVATSPRHGTTSDKLIGAADSAMYAAKSAGRNRVKAAPQTLPTPPPDRHPTNGLRPEAVESWLDR
jgi:diguanylate cyclase (GGDEF)-like protein/PAS domain S-box-containing protein